MPAGAPASFGLHVIEVAFLLNINIEAYDKKVVICCPVSSLLSKTRRRTPGSPKRTRTQSTSLEAKPRRR